MKVTISLLRDPTDADKIAPQAKTILAVLKEKAGGKNKAVARQDLIQAITDSKKLETRQDVGRVLSFYQPKLVEDGLIEVKKIEEPKAEKTAATKKEKPSAPGTKAKA